MTATKTKVRYWVVCGCYRRGPFSTYATADRVLDDIEAAGDCKLIHRVEEEAA